MTELNCSAEYFTTTWKKYDTDGNGYIEKDELSALLEDLARDAKGPKKQMTDDDIKKYKKQFLEKYDKNKDNRIDMKELAEHLNPEENFLFLIRTEAGPDSVEFKKIWDRYDSDHNGYIDTKELEDFLRDSYASSGNPLSTTKLAEYAKSALKLYDTNNDGKLEFKEMIKLLPLAGNYLKGLQFDKLSESDFKSIFAHYDKNKDNTIEGGELDKLFGDMLRKDGKKGTPESIGALKKSVMQHCDKNKDGKIQFQELALVLNFKA